MPIKGLGRYFWVGISKITSAALHWRPVPFKGVTHIPNVGDTLSIAKHRLLLDIRPEGLSSQQIMRIREAYEQSWKSLPPHLQELLLANKVKTVVGVTTEQVFQKTTDLALSPELLKELNEADILEALQSNRSTLGNPHYHPISKRVVLPLKTKLPDEQFVTRAMENNDLEALQNPVMVDALDLTNASAEDLAKFFKHESSHAVGYLKSKSGGSFPDGFFEVYFKEYEAISNNPEFLAWSSQQDSLSHKFLKNRTVDNSY